MYVQDQVTQASLQKPVLKQSRRLFLYLSLSLIAGFSRPALGMMLASDRHAENKTESQADRMDEGRGKAMERQRN